MDPHVEIGPGSGQPLKCWCGIGHDHTFDEFIQAVENGTI